MIPGIVAGGMRRAKRGYYGVIASTFARTSTYATDPIIDFRTPSTTNPDLWHTNYDETHAFGLYSTTDNYGWTTPTGDKTFDCSPNDVFELRVNNGAWYDSIATMSLDFMTEDNTVLYRILYNKGDTYATSILAGPPSDLVERKGYKPYPNPIGKLTLSQSGVSWVDSQSPASNGYTPPFTSSVDLSQLKKLRVYNFRCTGPQYAAFAYLIQDHRP